MKVDKKMQDGLWDWMKAITFALLLVIIIRFFCIHSAESGRRLHEPYAGTGQLPLI